MAINNFLSTVWSENLLTALDSKYIGVANCNRDYEGDIKEKGSIVRICGVGDMSVMDYVKNQDISSYLLEDTSVDLCIDQAKYFNFQIDDIDRAQSSPKLMDLALRVAANSLSDVADQYVYYTAGMSENRLFFDSPNADNILDTILEARKKLYENNVNDTEEVVLEVSPAIAALLIKAKTNLSNTDEALENGCIGKIFGCKVFVTKNVHTGYEGDNVTYKCVMRTKRAVAFAEQISDIMAYRPEKRFSDAVKGLHLYGAKIVYPKEVLALHYTVSTI